MVGSGASGRLVVLNRAGRAGKAYRLPAGGAVTLGSAPASDVRLMVPSVEPHHATLLAQRNQVVIRNEGGGSTLVNGSVVSVAGLREGDEIVLGRCERRMRWHYDRPPARPPPPAAQAPALALPSRPARTPRRVTTAHPAEPLRAPHRALLDHRASMPANARSGGKQVAIVQPQRRDTSEPAERASPPLAPARAPRAPAPAASYTDTHSPAHTPQATLWMESRKAPRRTPRSAPRSARAPRAAAAPRAPARRALSAGGGGRTPLRVLVLRGARSAPKPRVKARHSVTKIQAPTTVDHMKQAALMLMTGHKPAGSPAGRSPASRAPAGSPQAGAPSPERPHLLRQSDIRNDTKENDTSADPVVGASPRKSALRDPRAGRGLRKSESIKFDLSNLPTPRARSHPDTTRSTLDTTRSTLRDDTLYTAHEQSSGDLTLRYSDSPSPARSPAAGSPSPAPSPRRSIHSRGDTLLALAGSPLPPSPPAPRTSPRAPASPPARKSLRTSLMVHRALDDSRESYSIVDLVSDSSSVYGSVCSAPDTPPAPRRTRSALAASTPRPPAAAPAPRRSASLTTPENSEETLREISARSARPSRPSRPSRSRSRLADVSLSPAAAPRSPRAPRRPASAPLSPLSPSILPPTSPKSLRLSTRSSKTESPRSSESTSNASKRDSRANVTNASKWSGRATGSTGSSWADRTDLTAGDTRSHYTLDTTAASSADEGTVTPENETAPGEQGTPVLSIQSLLDSSRSRPRGPPAPAPATRRNTTQGAASFTASVRKSLRALGGGGGRRPGHVTPRRSGTLVSEAVKNKHSTAKKPQSKRSIIDDLDDSDVVKELFSSPVKRKLSQSMTEFSRKRLFEDEGPPPTPPSPPSPDLAGVKRLFGGGARDDLTDVRGVRALLRARRSAGGDLRDVAGVKRVFGRAPRDRLSDVRVKAVFAAPPRDDLTRVDGVGRLFKAQKERTTKNDLSDVAGVRRLFRKSPRNSLSDLSGVKRTFATPGGSPKNKSPSGKNQNESGMSGVSRLDDSTSFGDSESAFDRLLGRPPIRAVYSKSLTKPRVGKRRTRRALSLSRVDPADVERWLEEELRKRLQKKSPRKPRVEDAPSPARQSRVRGSTLTSSRLEASAGGGGGVGARGGARTSGGQYAPHTLPIKKRALLHSTPVKGNRYNLTMNASELGRVSPIAPPAPPTAAHDSKQTESSPGRKSKQTKNDTTVRIASPPRPRASLRVVVTPLPTKRKTKSITDVPTTSTKAEEQPQKRSRRGARPDTAGTTEEPAPKKTRATRAKRSPKAEPPAPAPKKRRGSLVVPKKPPIMSPRKARSRNAKEPKEVETERKREAIVEKPATKKRGAKVTFAVPEPAAGSDPRSRRGAAGAGGERADESPANKRRRVRGVEPEESSPPKRARRGDPRPEPSAPANTRAKKPPLHLQDPDGAPTRSTRRAGAAPSRKRKAAESASPVPAKVAKTIAKKTDPVPTPPSPAPAKGKARSKVGGKGERVADPPPAPPAARRTRGKEQTSPAGERARSSAKETKLSPVKKKVSPAKKKVVAVKKKVSPVKKKATPIKKQATPTGKKVTAAKKVTSVDEKVSPVKKTVAKKVSPPVKKASPPVKKATPPAKKATPPAKKTTPPAKKATPPAKKPKAPVKKAATPAKASPVKPRRGRKAAPPVPSPAKAASQNTRSRRR